MGSQRLLAAGELAAGIAHNLNNILVGILAPAQRLQDGQTTELSRDAGIIVSAAERARDLVERLNCGTDWERSVRLESVDVAAVTAEAIEAARPRWEEVQTAGGQIVVSSQLGTLPPAKCDRTELHDAILNLILNAVDAMPEGGQVTIAAEVDQKNVILIVSDTGTGFGFRDITPSLRALLYDESQHRNRPWAEHGLSFRTALGRRHFSDQSTRGRHHLSPRVAPVGRGAGRFGPPAIRGGAGHSDSDCRR